VKHVIEYSLKMFPSNLTKLPSCSARLAKVCTLSNLLAWYLNLPDDHYVDRHRLKTNCSHLSIVFIAEITGRAFIVADSNKRRTLSRADIAKALTKSDHFDFLIDIVPREEAAFSGQPAPSPSVPGASGAGVNGAGGAGTSVGAIMRKGGSGGKHDMVSNANTYTSFIRPFHLACLLLLIIFLYS
jgi:hypothetical protein